MSSWCRLLALVLLSTACAFAAEDPQSPWTDEWTMVLKGDERWFIDYDGRSYLRVRETDKEDLGFLNGKEVMIQAKFQQLKADTAEFYTFPTLTIGRDSEMWSTFIDGDNVYILGTVKDVAGQKITFKTRHVLRAPSDSSIIASRLAEIDKDDLDAQIKFANEIRKTGNKMGNRAVWISAADDIVNECIERLNKTARTEKNINKVVKAMNWAIDELGDTSRAAVIGSQKWIDDLDKEQKEIITERMGILGFVRYDGRWVTKREEKILSFEKKLRSIDPNDDKAYLMLSRSIAQYRDVLPEALELQHKALQAGLRHNPDSNLLRQALGKKTVEEEQAEQTVAAAYIDDQSGLSIPVPNEWQRSKDAIEGDVSWIDPNSDTAYISLTIIRGAAIDTFLPSYNQQLDLIKARQGYAEVKSSSLGLASASRETHFNFMEGREQRDGMLAGILVLQADTVYLVYASYIPEESASVKAAYQEILKAFEPIKAEQMDIKEEQTDNNDARTGNTEEEAEQAVEEGDGYTEGDPR